MSFYMALLELCLWLIVANLVLVVITSFIAWNLRLKNNFYSKDLMHLEEQFIEKFDPRRMKKSRWRQFFNR